MKPHASAKTLFAPLAIHHFLEYESTVLYDRLVTSPTTMSKAQSHVKEYKMAGFSGAVVSTDATHILLERVNNRSRQGHLGLRARIQLEHLTSLSTIGDKSCPQLQVILPAGTTKWFSSLIRSWSSCMREDSL
jgi:hypothetical protein